MQLQKDGESVDYSPQKVPGGSPRAFVRASNEAGEKHLQENHQRRAKKKNKKTKEEVTDEQLGGALPPTRKRVETPMRKAVRELHQHWQPLWGKNQATPPFAQMRAALQYDDTSFDTRTRTYNIPESAPTGRGAFADHRETSHYVGKVLESIHPSLAVVYRGGATNSHVHDIATNMHMESYVRAGPLGGLQRVTHKFK